MSKEIDPLKIMNELGKAAHSKAQPAQEPDEDDMPKAKSKKNSKQVAAMQEKKKGMPPAPKK